MQFQRSRYSTSSHPYIRLINKEINILTKSCTIHTSSYTHYCILSRGVMFMILSLNEVIILDLALFKL